MLIDMPAVSQNQLLKELGEIAISRRDSDAIRTLKRLAEQARAAESTTLGENHPLASIVGSLKGDPMLDVLTRTIKEYRNLSNAEEVTTE